MYPKNYLLFFLLLFFSGALLAQQEVIRLTAPKSTLLLAEDEARGSSRFAAPIILDHLPAFPPQAAKAEVSYQWSKTYTVDGAYGLGFLIDQIDLPEGGSLTISNAAGSRGPFTEADASNEHRFHTGFLPGDSITISYRGLLPAAPAFRVQRIDHVYRPDLYQPRIRKDFRDANECQVNTNCPSGAGWDDEQSGAARIRVVVQEGVGWCSGNLINNTAQDGRPLVLTGFHCVDGFTPLFDMWRLDFGYFAADCATPATEPTPAATYIGVRAVAGRRESDFLLLEITDATFLATEHFFAGWDRSDGDVSGVVTHFHHPQGDIQKIGQSGPNGMDVLDDFITWNSDVVTPRRHHYVMDYALGDFQTGSSGSAFFDANHRIRGQLNGGNANCPGTSEAFIGRLFQSWDQGEEVQERLRESLDPLAAGVETLDGATLGTKKFVSGFVVDGAEEPVADVKLTFQWVAGATSETTTNASGFYRVERPALTTGFFVAGDYRSDGPLDAGVDVGDVIAIRRHVLGLDTLSTEQLLAADVNGSGGLRVSDATRITRVILNVQDWGNRPNWVVLPINFPLDPLPVSVGEPVGVAINNFVDQDLVLNFFVLKTGDANQSVERDSE